MRMTTAPEAIWQRLLIAVTAFAASAVFSSASSRPAEGCFGPWLDTKNYSYCTARRMESDERTGKAITAPDPTAYYVRCRHGQAAGYLLYVTAGSPQAAARKRAAVCNAESPLRGVEYPAKLLNTLTR
jgi:hypothetical protein